MAALSDVTADYKAQFSHYLMHLLSDVKVAWKFQLEEDKVSVIGE